MGARRVHPTRRFWICSGLLAATLLLWAQSRWTYVAFRWATSSFQYSFGINSGCFVVDGFGPANLDRPLEGFGAGLVDEAGWKWDFNAEWNKSVGRMRFRHLHVPLWAPILVACGAGVFWRRNLTVERKRLGLCPPCGYDRRGLTIDTKCPECGSKP